MANKSKYISKTSMNDLLEEQKISRGPELLHSFTYGMNAHSSIVPTEVVSWVTTHDLAREGRKCHSRFVLKIPLNGENISCLDGQFFHLTPGNALLIFPYQIHANSPIPADIAPTEFFLVTFNIPNIAGQQFLLPLKNRVISLQEKWPKLLLQVISAYQHPEKVSSAEAVFSLSIVLEEMVYAVSDAEQQTVPQNRLAEICNYIKNNCNSNLDVNTLAEHFSLSPSTLRRLFSQGFSAKITPAHFIENVRIQHAIMELLYSGKTIGEIAISCGYRDAFGFSRAFRRITGISPREYRKEYGAQCK